MSRPGTGKTESGTNGPKSTKSKSTEPESRDGKNSDDGYERSTANDASFETGAGRDDLGFDSPPPDQSTLSLSDREASDDDRSIPPTPENPDEPHRERSNRKD